MRLDSQEYRMEQAYHAEQRFSEPPPIPRGWWFFPIFWGIVYCVGMALSAIALYQRDPAQLQGWAGIRLGALLIGNFGVYNLIAWGWLYRDRPLPAWRGPAYFSLQM